MTNAQIIAQESEQLVKEGKLKMVQIGNDLIPEPIHTFQAWKSMGYAVKKGEKSEIKFAIWKYTSKKYTDEKTNEEKEKSSMFLKTASFFRFDQVEKIA